MQLSDIPGNISVKKNLIDRTLNNSPITKILFIDKNGYGALAIAIAYAQFLSCTNKGNNDSCNNCSSCKKYNALVHPDLHFSYPYFANKAKNINNCIDVLDSWRKLILKNPFIDINSWIDVLQSKTNSLNIPASECSNKVELLNLTAYESEYKVLIIWHTEYLGKNANILLKLVEEANTNTIIIAITDCKEKLLPTFVSRFESIDLNAISTAELQKYIHQNYQNINDNAITEAIEQSNGSISQLYNYLHKQNASYKHIIEWLRLCYKGDIIKLINFVNNISANNREFQKNILLNVLETIREGLNYKYISQHKHLKTEKEIFINNFIKLFNVEKLNISYDLLNDAIIDLEKNINSKILFLDVSLQLNKILK